ncbi:MAG: HD domain-containing protein, partial [Thermoanaerobaculum sp.]|nr:HD domain-containing protein [Thermoanaerobaculum sp.]MDW7967535.1 HD domain-containing protein [Thermoanaerobaculum sp.]
MRWPFFRSLLFPLTGLLVALAVVPVVLVGFGFFTSNREQIATLEKQYLTRQAVGFARELELFFVETVGRLEGLSQAMAASAENALPMDRVPAILSEVIKGNRSVIMLRVLDRQGQGQFVQGKSLSPEAEERLAPLLAKAFRQGVAGYPVREDLVNLPGEPPVVVVSFPIVDREGEVLGVLQGVVSLAGMSERLGEEAARGVVVDVVDRRGFILFSSEGERLGQDASQHPLVAQFLRAPGVRLTKTYADPFGHHGEVLGSLCPVGDPAWAVITARSVNVAFANLNAMAKRTAFLALAAGVLATVAGVVLARRITNPLRQLAALSTAMASGDFTRRVPVTSANELGQLAENFNTMAEEIGRTVASLREALAQNRELLVDAIRALSASIDAKNPYTRGHSERVARYSVAIARHLGLNGEEVRKVEIAALLHDVGKIGIEDAILTKPDQLTELEFAKMRAHTIKGAAIVSSIKLLRDIIPGIRSHHENWSGGGYPDGLSGEAIPLV